MLAESTGRYHHWLLCDGIDDTDGLQRRHRARLKLYHNRCCGRCTVHNHVNTAFVVFQRQQGIGKPIYTVERIDTLIDLRDGSESVPTKATLLKIVESAEVKVVSCADGDVCAVNTGRHCW